ncbi:MAG: Coenzyme F420 hydrogenase/dehydrogenase, beta subunit C-terminal domain [Planctomycetota bacterium]
MTKTTSLPTLDQVVSGHLCNGCGACAFAHPDKIEMYDTESHGRRPRSTIGATDELSTISAESICPGVNPTGVNPTGANRHVEVGGISELRGSWGTVFEVWEGYACDDEIRFRGSSGGVATALALHALEQSQFEGVVHVRAKEDAALLNETVFSQSRESLLKGAGSRYAPASPCDGLQRIAESDRPCVFIGKPCDVAGASMARQANQDLDNKLGLSMAIFCAGEPSIEGTIELAKRLGADSPEQIERVRYRGNGWPGDMEVTLQPDENGVRRTESIPYDRGWGEVLQRHRPWRCHVCADHTGESADLSIGDPWYRPRQPGDPGRSLVLVRTERGRRALQRAMHDGYVKMERKPPSVLDASQPHLLRAQSSVWGRVLACKMAGVAVPRHRGRRRIVQWLKHLRIREQMQSILGTWKRVKRKRLNTSEVSKEFHVSPCDPIEARSDIHPARELVTIGESQ